MLSSQRIKRSFTLIEVVSAIFLLGLLTTMVSFKVISVIQHHKEKEKLSFLYNQLTQVIETSRLKGVEKKVSIDNRGKDLIITSSDLKKSIVIQDVHTQDPTHFYISEEGRIESKLALDMTLGKNKYRCEVDTSKFPATHIYVVSQ